MIAQLRGWTAVQRTTQNNTRLGITLGATNAVGFKVVGFITTVPLAVVLLLLVWRPLFNDVKSWVTAHTD